MAGTPSMPRTVAPSKSRFSAVDAVILRPSSNQKSEIGYSGRSLKSRVWVWPSPIIAASRRNSTATSGPVRPGNQAPDSFDLAPERFFGNVSGTGQCAHVVTIRTSASRSSLHSSGSQALTLRGWTQNLLRSRLGSSQVERPLLAFQRELAARSLWSDKEVKICARAVIANQLAADAVAVRLRVLDHVCRSRGILR